MSEFTKPVSNFDVLKTMADRDMDIALCPDVLNMRYSQKAKGTKVQMGVPGNPIAQIMYGKKQAVLLIWDVEQFDAVKAELEATNDPK